MKRFEGKVCVVTGGVNGLGAASVRRFLEEGASVAIGRTWASLMRQFSSWQ